MALERGKLVLSKKGKPQIEIDGKRFNPAQGEVSQSILERLAELNGKEMEFEREGGQPKKIREVGSEFVPAHTGATRAGDSRNTRSTGSPHHQANSRSSIMPPDFHNPYNFVPAPPRNTDDPDLGDHKPISQDRFHPNHYTGRIRVEMETIAPLLVPDPNRCREDNNGHKTFELLVGQDGTPLIPSSSIRGMLRSAYEAVTNSRFGRFSRKDNDKRLAYRMEAREGLRLIPARIDNGQVRLLTGSSTVGENGTPNGTQYAAWLPRYSGNDKATTHAVKYPDGSLPQHADEVQCWVELFQHHRWDRNKNKHIADFQYWKVRSIARSNGAIGDQPNPSPQTNAINGRSWHNPQGEMRQIQCFVCITNANINRKHDERVFFCINTTSGPFPVTDELRQKWTELIDNYQEIHEEDLKKRERQNQGSDEYFGGKPGRTAWSRHVYTQEDMKLRDGALCYARLTADLSNVDALFPVMISRELYTTSPWDLLDSSLRPAATISELSPADRVFGWVMTDSGSQKKISKQQSAVRGLLRVGPVTCESSVEDSLEIFPEEGLPLAILAAPKPQQGRFYVAASPRGEAQNDGLSKLDAGYVPGKGLRGRKVYPHHQDLPANHWENPLEDRTQSPQGPWQEYRRPAQNGQEQRDDQNRSMLGWVKPGSRFCFDIHVTNLSKVELGALLFLFHLPKNNFHRFGGGKPLGFGSVRLSARDCELWTEEALRGRYRSWASQSSPQDISEDAIKDFKKAILGAYGSGAFEQVFFIEAFLRTCRGFDDNLPVHYPRVTQDGRPGSPNPAGESFKWFVANEKQGARYSLRNLGDDDGLPTLQAP